MSSESQIAEVDLSEASGTWENKASDDRKGQEKAARERPKEGIYEKREGG